MTKSKKILIISNCLLLLFMFLMPVFMVGCAGEDTSTLTFSGLTLGTSGYYEFAKGSTEKANFANLTVTFTPEYDYVVGGNTYNKSNPFKATGYTNILDNGFIVTGYYTGEKSEQKANGEWNYKTITISYLNKMCSFNYIVVE